MTVTEPARTGRGWMMPFVPPLILLAVMWGLEVVDVALRGRLDSAGIIAREPDGLPRILAAPFLHAGFEHLMSNTIPLLILGAVIAWHSRRLFWTVTAVVILLGGLGTWLIAPPDTITVGASGLVFGYLGYLLVAAVRTRAWLDLLIAVAVVLVYGGLLAGALPWVVGSAVSWQAHLCGTLAGGLCAWWWPPPARGRSDAGPPS